MEYEFQRLRSENAGSFCGLCALGSRSGEDLAGLRRRALMLDRKIPEGFDGTVAVDPAGYVSGFLVFLPIESCGLALEGRNLNVIQCIHVRPDRRGQQLAKELLAQAISLSRDRDGLAVVAWDSRDHFPDDFFRHFAFRVVDSFGPLRLMVRLFRNLPPPHWTVREECARLVPGNGDHILHVFDNLICGRNLPTLRQLRELVAAEYSGRLRMEVHLADEPAGPRSPCFELTTYLDGRLLSVGHLSREEFRERLEAALGDTPDFEVPQ